MTEENRLLREDNKNLLQLVSEKNAECIEIMTQQHQNEQQIFADSILSIHTEIKQITQNITNMVLRLKENKLLQEKNHKEIVNKVTHHQQTLHDLIIKQNQEMNDICKSIEQHSIQNKKDMINHTDILQEQWQTDLNNLAANIKNYDTDVRSMLKDIINSNEELLKYVLDNKDILLDQGNQLLNMTQQYSHITKQTDSIEDIQNKIVDLAGTVHQLWMIMKLVWVDTVISDIDSLT